MHPSSPGAESVRVPSRSNRTASGGDTTDVAEGVGTGASCQVPHYYRVSIQVVAHRGYSSEEPEHSMAAYLRAVEAGADAVECDVRMTADGTLVLVHDRRIDRTSPGSGAVSNFMLAELQEHTFGGHGWHDFEDPPSELRTRLLTLETFLSTLLDASPTLEFAIETKHPIRFGKYVEEELARVLRSFGLVRNGSVHRVRMMSFSRMAVVRMKRLVPAIPTVYLCGRRPWFYRDGRLPPGVSALGPGIDVVREHPELVAAVKSRGGQVHVWVVDERADFDLCRDLGVDVIISNKPAQILAWLGR